MLMHFVLAHDHSYTRWWTSRNPYEVTYEEPYEPYVIAHRLRLPRFDERFRQCSSCPITWLQVWPSIDMLACQFACFGCLHTLPNFCILAWGNNVRVIKLSNFAGVTVAIRSHFSSSWAWWSIGLSRPWLSDALLLIASNLPEIVYSFHLWSYSVFIMSRSCATP